MSKIQTIVNQLRSLALSSQLNKRHAAAVIMNGKIITKASNTERTHQKFFHCVHNTSICCSTHAEMDAIRKAYFYLHWEKQYILWN